MKSQIAFCFMILQQCSGQQLPLGRRVLIILRATESTQLITHSPGRNSTGRNRGHRGNTLFYHAGHCNFESVVIAQNNKCKAVLIACLHIQTWTVTIRSQKHKFSPLTLGSIFSPLPSSACAVQQFSQHHPVHLHSRNHPVDSAKWKQEGTQI